MIPIAELAVIPDELEERAFALAWAAQPGAAQFWAPGLAFVEAEERVSVRDETALVAAVQSEAQVSALV